MSPPELNGNVICTRSKSDNGVILSPASSGNGYVRDSYRALEHVQQDSAQGIDEHLLEFSEALRTVAKALRRVSEAKASAQAEAAEWRRKYEAERERNSRIEPPVTLSDDGCCAKHGICSHDVLHDMDDTDEVTDDPAMSRKASFKLSWEKGGEQQQKRDIVFFERGNITTAERSSKQISLRWESPPQTVLILSKPNSTAVRVLCTEMVRWLKEQRGLGVFVEPRVRSELLSESPYFGFVQSWADDEEMTSLHGKVDVVITLGGDGTVLWTASMFRGPVPPVVPFSLGSLGFMTPFHSEHYRDYLDSILNGPFSITLRHRLQCHIVRESLPPPSEHGGDEPVLVLNEVTIDRGISSFLTNLECYCDNHFVTSVQGDGLILSTTSGSTAYSLAAGGSMVHPQVPAILFTPICPHSLSFRPLILPEYVVVRVQVPYKSRGHAWVSFDGKDRKKLAPGDALVCSMSPWPVPTACQAESTGDFLHSIHEGLHWNVRKTQSFDGPRDL